ncbi:MAG: preprotein translocase subunit SecG [Bacteroidia bacterium]|nr:preprotein translocase subunit SecG [Bacteroidia bacterium]
MYIALTILIILACVLLVLAVLVQNPKGGGLAVGFSSSNQVMGVRKTTDFLEKFTWGLLISLIVFCLVGTIILPSGGQRGAQSILQEKAENATTAPAQSQPSSQAPAQNAQPQPVRPEEVPPNNNGQ